MSELLTMQDLANGHLDVKALGEAANGDENTIVTTRTGNTYPSAERAIKTMFQNGGLPAQPFATKALMTASALANGSYAQVTDDTVNNGLYVKTAGAWAKSGYDPLAQSKTYTAKNALLISNVYNLSDDLEQNIDAEDIIYRRVDRNGDVHLINLPEAVQPLINKINKSVGADSINSDIELLLDANGAVVRRTDERGAVYISTGKGSIQHFVREPITDKERHDFSEPLKTQRESYTQVVRDAVTKLQAECLPYIEPPLLLVPNNYNVPNSILNEIVLSDDNPVALLPFPYGVGGSVHPYALPLRKPLYGYRNLLVDSSHLNGTESEETPVMFGTNDWVNFDLIPDIKQPMMTSKSGTDGRAKDGFMSDPWLAYDPTDGALIYGTRDITTDSEIEGDTGVSFYATKTYDGIRWTETSRFRLPGTADQKSSSMLYDHVNKIWHWWSVATNGAFDHYTSTSWNSGWTLVSSKNFRSLFNIDIWHGEVKFVGDKFALVCNSRQETSQVYMGFSTDGDNWVMSQGLVVPQSPNIYKPSFIVEFKDSDTVRFVFFWSHWNWISRAHDPKMPLHIQASNWITLSSLT